MFNRTLGLFLLAAASLIVWNGCGGDDTTKPTVEANRAWVENTTCPAGGSIDVQVMFHNEVPINFAQVPIKFSSSVCTVESVTFNPELPDFLDLPPLTGTDLDPEALRVNMVWLATEEVPPGDWLLATVHVTIAVDAAPQTVVVDKYSYIEELNGQMVQHQVNFGNTASASDIIIPEFSSGKIVVVGAGAVVDPSE